MNWRSQSMEALRSERDQLVFGIEPRLPTFEDFGLQGDHKQALREIEQLISDALKPNDHGERAELLYLKALIFVERRKHQEATFASQECASEATKAFFGSKKHSLWPELCWQRIKTLGEQKRWLPFERALSEMIGWLAGSSRSDHSHDLSAARYARGLCYQLRGLESDDPASRRALLAAALRDLEKVPERDGSDRAIEAARDRIARWQKEPDEPRTLVSSSLPHSMGLVRFPDLPQETQALFLNGANFNSRGRFFAETSPYGILFVLGLFLFFAFVFALGLRGIFGPLSLIGILATVPAIIMVASAVKIVRDLLVYSQKKRAGAIVYGFLIDEEKLAVRTIEAFSDYTYFFGKNSVLLPLGRIRSSWISQKATYGNGRQDEARRHARPSLPR